MTDNPDFALVVAVALPSLALGAVLVERVRDHLKHKIDDVEQMIQTHERGEDR